MLVTSLSPEPPMPNVSLNATVTDVAVKAVATEVAAELTLQLGKPIIADVGRQGSKWVVRFSTATGRGENRQIISFTPGTRIIPVGRQDDKATVGNTDNVKAVLAALKLAWKRTALNMMKVVDVDV